MRREVDEPSVVLESVHDRQGRHERLLQTLGADEREVVGRRVVLRELAFEGTGQAADREVKPRRVELTLVPSPGNEVEDASTALRDHVGRGSVHERIAAAAALVRDGPGVAEASDDQAGLDPRNGRLVQGEPGDRTDGPGGEEEPVGQSSRDRGQRRGKLSEQGDAGEVVVRERRVTHVRREEDFRLYLSRQVQLTVRE